MDDEDFIKVDPETFEMYERGQWSESIRKIWAGLMTVSIASFVASVWLLSFERIHWLFPIMWAIILTIVATLPTSPNKKK